MSASGRRWGHPVRIPSSTAPGGQGVPPRLCFQSRARRSEHRDGLARATKRPHCRGHHPETVLLARKEWAESGMCGDWGPGRGQVGHLESKKLLPRLPGACLWRHQSPPVLLPELRRTPRRTRPPLPAAPPPRPRPRPRPQHLLEIFH